MPAYNTFYANAQKKESTSDFHYPMEREFQFYNLISSGRLQEVQEALKKMIS